MWSRFIELLRRPHQRWFVQLLIIVNIFGSAYGYYWYRGQLAANPIIAWPVIPDSPRSTTFFTVAMILLLLGREVPWFQALAYTAVIKYGVWAVAMISHAWLLGDGRNFTDWMLRISHAGKALQGAVFLRHLRVTRTAVIVPAVWMVFNDLVDYILLLHPYLFADEQLIPAMLTAMGATLVLTWILIGKRRIIKA